jgi:hypothetical protein
MSDHEIILQTLMNNKSCLILLLQVIYIFVPCSWKNSYVGIIPAGNRSHRAKLGYYFSNMFMDKE